MTAARPNKTPKTTLGQTKYVPGFLEDSNPVPTPEERVSQTEPRDPWKHRSEYMRCRTCMFYVNMRCRRHAPTINGYPAVYPSDWCGDHKLSKEQMGGF